MVALEIEDVAAPVDRFLDRAHTLRFRFLSELPWEKFEPHQLTDAQIAALRLVTLVEDHLPDYLASYATRFPINDSVDLPTAAAHRRLHFFVSQWAAEEDGHAYILTQYLERVVPDDSRSLALALVAEGRKSFSLPYTDPLQILTYTLIQEKATQTYYRQLAGHVQEPVLSALLRGLARDEGRHYVFFLDTVSTILRRRGSEAADKMLSVVDSFRMPLSDVLAGRWRLALKAQEAVPEHDHRDAFAAVHKLVANLSLSTAHIDVDP